MLPFFTSRDMDEALCNNVQFVQKWLLLNSWNACHDDEDDDDDHAIKTTSKDLWLFILRGVFMFQVIFGEFLWKHLNCLGSFMETAELFEGVLWKFLREFYGNSWGIWGTCKLLHWWKHCCVHFKMIEPCKNLAEMTRRIFHKQNC